MAQGFFGVNMASTGCGKTLANVRIIYALADSQRGARFTVALGLRTLTRQTGEAYRERFKLQKADLAVRVGGVTIPTLRNGPHTQSRWNGSESSESLLPEGSVLYEGSLEDGPLKQWRNGNSAHGGKTLSGVLGCG
jgi:CRISPR-associated endonuclease/helicase Cas3